MGRLDIQENLPLPQSSIQPSLSFQHLSGAILEARVSEYTAFSLKYQTTTKLQSGSATSAIWCC